jgi:hypothetical protein
MRSILRIKRSPPSCECNATVGKGHDPKRLEALGHLEGSLGVVASTNTQLNQGFGVKRVWLQWNTPPTCPAAESATRSLHIRAASSLNYLQMAPTFASTNRGAASP